MLIRTLSRVVCHLSGLWFSSPSSFSMSYSTKNRQMWPMKSELNRMKLKIRVLVTGSHSEEFGDGVRLGAAHAAVTWPHDPPLAVGDGFSLLWALQPHSHHPPVVTWPGRQSLICEVVPFIQAGDADGRLQDHLQDIKVLSSFCKILWNNLKY